MQDKIVKNIDEIIKSCQLKDGMAISFHHHLRNGDFVLNIVLDAIAKAGIKDIKLYPSALFDIHFPLINHIKNGVVSFISTAYISGKLGRELSKGILPRPILFKTHGGRAADILSGKDQIDLAFIAAPTVDIQANVTGKQGVSACGSLGYAMADAQKASYKIAVTDHMIDDTLDDISIPGEQIDFILKLDHIGQASGIVSGTTQITRDPIGLLMAEYAAKAIQASGLLKDGFSFQTGAGGASLATSKFLTQMMKNQKIKGSFAMGGITGYLVDMAKEGLFKDLMDVQCFDLKAVDSISKNKFHHEISAAEYASPDKPDALVNDLDVVILGATEIDTNFNVNVHTDSSGFIMGGSGGHSDTAAGSKIAMILAPLVRARMPLILDRVKTISTPGESIDVLITQFGLAVNPQREDLIDKLKEAKLPVFSIYDLKEKAESLTGKPQLVENSATIVGQVMYRNGEIIDLISAQE